MRLYSIKIMFSKIFYHLSKKASRKNLEVFISNSLQEASLKKREHKVLNIGAGGEIEKFIRIYFDKVYSIDNDKKSNDLQSEEELKGVIDLYRTSNPDYEQEKEMLQSILQLNDLTVEEIFTHRKNIYSIDSSIDTKYIIEILNFYKYIGILKFISVKYI